MISTRFLVWRPALMRGIFAPAMSRSPFSALPAVALAAALSVLAQAALAQRYYQTDARFADAYAYEAAEGERVLKTWYHYVVSRHGMRYVVRTFFPETGALTSLHTYADRGLRVLDGPYALYSDDGEAATEGSYAMGELDGPWQTATKGQVLVAGAYDAGLRVGTWTEHYPNGALKSSFAFEGGEELGPYVMYDTTGVVVDRGNSILGERYTELPPAEFEARRGRHIVDEFPCFGACDPDLSIGERAAASGLAASAYIREQLTVPDVVKKYGIGGRVNASVLIDEQGRVAAVDIVNGLCQPLADECRRILEGMPAWRPGTKAGKPAAVRVLVPFAFSVE